MPYAYAHPQPHSVLPLRVFLAEDSRAVRERLVEQLNDLPHVQVVGTADCEDDAVESLRLIPCDVLILDIKLREGSGIGILRQLHELEAAHDLPRVRIVFSSQTAARTFAERYGAQHFFDKSSDSAALIGLIQELSGHA